MWKLWTKIWWVVNLNPKFEVNISILLSKGNAPFLSIPNFLKKKHLKYSFLNIIGERGSKVKD